MHKFWLIIKDYIGLIASILGLFGADLFDIDTLIVKIILSLFAIFSIYKLFGIYKFFFKSYNPYILIKIIRGIHDFQHLYIDNIRMYKGNNDKVGISEVHNLINKIQEILALIDEDISINVKVFINTNKNTIDITSKDVKNTILQTFSRARSNQERDNQHILRSRNNEETYKVTPDRDASYLFNNAKQTEKIKQNSAFNAVVGNEHYFIANNLIKLDEDKKYYNSSKDWKKYYKSIAIFIIAPRQSQDTGEVPNPFGFLIADSPNKNSFRNQALFKALMGYFSHRLYSFMRNTILKNNSNVTLRQQMLNYQK